MRPTGAIYCPETKEECENELCQHRIKSADNGNPTETRDVELACGESWLMAQIECDECGERVPLGDVSFAACRRCRRLEGEGGAVIRVAVDIGRE